MSTESDNPKKIWTEEERLELAAKLDEELDSFIAGLEKKRYAEGWPEDRWEEEMNKHPFFMKKAPQPGDEVHPMFEGLQKLKYDPEENTNEELALNYKEDGNFYMKHKKFRMAVYSFTEGIKAKCTNPEVLAMLYNNRSAAHFFLQNYRSSLLDAEKAFEYKPDYYKAIFRAAQCCFALENYPKCESLCSTLLENNSEDIKAKELLLKSKSKKLEKERNNRKELLEAKKKSKDFNELCSMLYERGIKFDDMKKNGSITEDLLKPKFLPLEDHPVSLDTNEKILLWPIAYQYPEFLMSEFDQQMPENMTMKDILLERISEPLPFDMKKQYKPDTVNVYYINRKDGKVHKVNINKTIQEILKEDEFFVSGGSLLFYIVLKNSEAEKDFICKNRK